MGVDPAAAAEVQSKSGNGTASADSPDPPVVSPDLRIIGTSNLFVAGNSCLHHLLVFVCASDCLSFLSDASVIPTVPNGNVHATVAAVASRAADIFLRSATAVIDKAPS